MIDAFRTITTPASARIARKKSRFLGHAFPIGSEDELSHRLDEIRGRFHDATHHCYAYRLLKGFETVSHIDDAGEPSGSAGLPILHVLEETELLNVLLIVVRYFGGTKLGLGGLIRAYSDAAQATLAAAQFIVRRVDVEVSIRFPPEVNSRVMGTIHRYGAEVREIEYGENAHVLAAVRPSLVSAFKSAIREASGDRAVIEGRE